MRADAHVNLNVFQMLINSPVPLTQPVVVSCPRSGCSGQWKFSFISSSHSSPIVIMEQLPSASPLRSHRTFSQLPKNVSPFERESRVKIMPSDQSCGITKWCLPACPLQLVLPVAFICSRRLPPLPLYPDTTLPIPLFDDQPYLIPVFLIPNIHSSHHWRNNEQSISSHANPRLPNQLKERPISWSVLHASCKPPSFPAYLPTPPPFACFQKNNYRHTSLMPLLLLKEIFFFSHSPTLNRCTTVWAAPSTARPYRSLLYVHVFITEKTIHFFIDRTISVI